MPLTTGAALLTLLAQGLTIEKRIRRLGLDRAALDHHRRGGAGSESNTAGLIGGRSQTLQRSPACAMRCSATSLMRCASSDRVATGCSRAGTSS